MTTVPHTMLPLDFRAARILVVGDLMLDQYWLGQTGRISPEAPVPVVKVTSTEMRLGGAANAALNARSLGANVTLAGILGDDDNAAHVRTLLDDQQIEDLSVVDTSASTITKLRMISRGQHVVRADFEDTFSDAAINALVQKVSDAIEGFDLILLSDYKKGALDHCEQIIEAARKHGKPVIIDPKGQDFSHYRHAALLTPNLSEFEAIVGSCKDEQDMFHKADQLIKQLDLGALLLTRSEQGMTLFNPDGSHHHFNATAKEVYDVTGAGDTVIATLACAMTTELPLDEAVMLANTAASIVVGRMGAATVTPLELKLALDNAGAQPSGITTIEQLVKLVQFEQSLGKKIVFTNGCFDILHKGHAQYLQEAGLLGDRLIVAVNSDESVARLKGPTRPINTVDDRMAVISSLKSVDWVLNFTEDTPEGLLHALKPDILVKGGDYQIDQVVGADIVAGYGGKVAVLSLQKGRSTTNIIDSIKSH
ncbi:Bifunctional protein HldE [BD1-7 clade bacterium]|uniref:Bifunctional protein HldE n=1 Tax=BD1-7 clade bacterium TaxID=2029982 RepID=A0A5S9NM93_9GAMM|nr:Bifunctional protein HldE [BD1-7 clade bacterium]CAA0093735.1 Bifunctional protein HldE [BD1-7 clade bacterium]